jgi:hypothetical protein
MSTSRASSSTPGEARDHATRCKRRRHRADRSHRRCLADTAEETGGVTIPISAMPGSACVYRIMMYPYGERLGLKSIVDGTKSALAAVANHIDNVDAARTLIVGEGA